MGSLPLVSICVPAYNSGQYIGETLDCLLSQSYENLEIIIIDDGSSDNTSSIVKGFKDERLHYYRQPNAGAAAARNYAFEKSMGSFIKFMDSDDLISSTCIEVQVKAIRDKDDAVASAKWGVFVNSDRSDFKLVREKVWKNLPGIDWVVESLIDYGRNMTQPGIFLIPRNLIKRAGLWNEKLSLIDDFDFMTRVLTETDKVIFCEEAILYYRNGLPNSLSRQNSRYHMESAYKAQIAGISKILQKENSQRSRLACANSLQSWAFGFYPNHMDLYNLVNERIEFLGGSSLKMEGGKFLRILRNLFGWQKAKRIKIALNRYRNIK